MSSRTSFCGAVPFVIVGVLLRFFLQKMWMGDISGEKMDIFSSEALVHVLMSSIINQIEIRIRVRDWMPWDTPIKV